jgi:ATP-dependent helicase HepA
MAMANEPVSFVTWDHPIVSSSIDLMLTGEQGSSAFGQIPGTAAQAGVICECLFVLEAVSPPALGADRFLPPMTIHAVVDHNGKDITSSFDSMMVKDGDRNWLKAKLPVLSRMVPPMSESAEGVAERDAKALRKRALKQMDAFLGEQIDRLERLKALGHPVRPSEFEAATAEREALREHITGARLRLDSIRLIVIGGKR